MMRCLIPILLLLTGQAARADTLQVQRPLPGSSIEQQVSVLFGSLEDKSGLTIVSYSEPSIAEEIKTVLLKNGISDFRIKTLNKDAGDHPADIVYSPSKYRGAKLPADDLRRLMNNTPAGGTIALRNIGFVPGKAVITKSSYPELEKLFDILKQNARLKVQFEGHVCCLSEKEGDTTTSGYKMSLSRAKAVYEYLSGRGIEISRMSYIGLSSWRRPRKEQSEAEEIRNRRVEIRILEK